MPRRTHPGEMLREDFLPECGLTAADLAEALGLPVAEVEALLGEERQIDSETANLLARLFGNSPEFWLNAQRAVDQWSAAGALHHRVDRASGERCDDHLE